jgi:hypothetical protein
MTTPESQARIRQQGMIVAPMDVKTFNTFVNSEALRLKPVIFKAGIKVE